MENLGKPTLFQFVLQSFDENGGNENILVEVEKLIQLYPQYTDKKWIFLQIMKEKYSIGFVEGYTKTNNLIYDSNVITINFDEELKQFIEILEKTTKEIGEKNGEENKKRDDFIIRLVNEYLNKENINYILKNTDSPQETCPVNQELIDELNNLNKKENCFPCENTYGFNLCKQEYSLCTSAKCIGLKSNPDIVVCYCDVLKGCSLGTQACDTLKPFKLGPLAINYSTFNPIQTASNCNKVIVYPNKLNSTTEFANCLNQICIKDPSNKNKSFCFCPTATSDVWETVGTSVNTNPNIILSGATQSGYQDTELFLQECKNIVI